MEPFRASCRNQAVTISLRKHHDLFAAVEHLNHACGPCRLIERSAPNAIGVNFGAIQHSSQKSRMEPFIAVWRKTGKPVDHTKYGDDFAAGESVNHGRGPVRLIMRSAGGAIGVDNSQVPWFGHCVEDNMRVMYISTRLEQVEITRHVHDLHDLRGRERLNLTGCVICPCPSTQRRLATEVNPSVHFAPSIWFLALLRLMLISPVNPMPVDAAEHSNLDFHMAYGAFVELQRVRSHVDFSSSD